jgi:hypothetical protein
VFWNNFCLITSALHFSSFQGDRQFLVHTKALVGKEIPAELVDRVVPLANAPQQPQTDRFTLVEVADRPSAKKWSRTPSPLQVLTEWFNQHRVSPLLLSRNWEFSSPHQRAQAIRHLDAWQTQTQTTDVLPQTRHSNTSETGSPTHQPQVYQDWAFIPPGKRAAILKHLQ